MKRLLFLFLSVVVFSSCGTTGHILFYHFSYSKYDVEKYIIRVIHENPSFQVPEKWKAATNGDYFERIYVYFMHDPKELYQIGFIGESKDWKASSSCTLGLVAQYDGHQFRYDSDLSRKEIKRITKRFQEEILSRLKFGYKSE